MNSSKGKNRHQKATSTNSLQEHSLSNSNVVQLFDRQIGEDLLTKTMLAEKLNYSVSYINKLMKQEKIPFLKNGRPVRFKYSDVVAALQKGSAA